MTRSKPKTTITLLAAAALLLTTTGCALVGAAGDAASGAIDATGTILHAGKFSNFSAIDRPRATTIARAVVTSLGMHLVKTYTHPDQQTFVYQDNRQQQVWITLISRTPVMTEIRVDVGLFGTDDLGRLVIRKIDQQLSPAASTQPYADNL
jgi:hypothetical protein